MLASADISIHWRSPPQAGPSTNWGLFTPPSNITPSPNRRRYFSEFRVPPPTSLPPQHFSSFSSWKLCCGQLLLRFSLRSGTSSSFLTYTCATAPHPPPPSKHHHHFHPDTASLSSPPYFPPLYPCLAFTVFISPFSVSPFSFLSFSTSVSRSPNPACQAWLHGC